MVTTITDPNTRAVLPLGNAYKYDQLNRLSTAISFTNLNTSTNTWGSGGTGIYANNFTYDANGNILTQLRKNESAAIVDSLRYFYQKNSAGKTTRNRLYHVYDATSSGTYSDDIDDMGTYSAGGTINTSNNYVYDESGRLIKDVQSGIQQITYRVDNKVKEIKRYSESGANMRFDYDAMGHRIAKHIYTEDFIDLIESTYYILDPKGNVVSTYQRKISSPSIYFTQKERFIYGSSRVGILRDSIPLLGSQNATYSQATWNHVIGKRNYELTNHLGNVLTVVSDKPLPHDNGSGSVDYFLAEILQASDYSAFGVQLSGRNFIASNAKEFRYGFNNMEADDEIKGSGNSYDYGARMLDPRLGRFLSGDPREKKFPSFSCYVYAANVPILFTDVNGEGPGDPVRLFIASAHNHNPIHSDQFYKAAEFLRNEYKSKGRTGLHEIRKAYTGTDIVSHINGQSEGSIKSVDIFSHMSWEGIWFYHNVEKDKAGNVVMSDVKVKDVKSGDIVLYQQDKEYNGLYQNEDVYESEPGIRDGYLQSSTSKNLSDIDISRFANDARVEFHGCESAGSDGVYATPEQVAARKTSNISADFSKMLYEGGKTNAVVIGHYGNSSPEGTYDYRQTGFIRRVYWNGNLILETSEGGEISQDVINKSIEEFKSKQTNTSSSNEE